jgi:hypothetical protein
VAASPRTLRARAPLGRPSAPRAGGLRAGRRGGAGGVAGHAARARARRRGGPLAVAAAVVEALALGLVGWGGTPWALTLAALHFSEQYLLAALLTGNDEWEVVLAAHALWRDRPAALTDAIPSLRHPGPVGPSSFWLRRA